VSRRAADRDEPFGGRRARATTNPGPAERLHSAVVTASCSTSASSGVQRRLVLSRRYRRARLGEPTLGNPGRHLDLQLE
jgi:hypothetical protein